MLRSICHLIQTFFLRSWWLTVYSGTVTLILYNRQTDQVVLCEGKPTLCVLVPVWCDQREQTVWMIVLLYGLRLLPAPHFNTTLIIPLFVVLVHQVLWLTSRELFFSFQLNYLSVYYNISFLLLFCFPKRHQPVWKMNFSLPLSSFFTVKSTFIILWRTHKRINPLCDIYSHYRHIVTTWSHTEVVWVVTDT